MIVLAQRHAFHEIKGGKNYLSEIYEHYSYVYFQSLIGVVALRCIFYALKVLLGSFSYVVTNIYSLYIYRCFVGW